MTLLEKTEADTSIPVGVAETPESLGAIHQPGCSAVIWQRQPLARFQSWIDTLKPEQLPRARVILRPEDARNTASEICEVCGTPNCPERALLIDDVAALAELFAELMSVPYMRLRLDVISTNACRKFHVDAVTARLICTYRGTGTQYGLSIDAAEPQSVFTVPTGAPILLRGTLWPDRQHERLLHRSPPIEGTGETRLLLVLDPVKDPGAFPVRPSMH
ncbi:DUF1826 domain-containing protein [Bauldia sp.]|uniref:DUF1826 domain-containing protein n=1 Tax=Bauldia sp. TaxID=2575872 RepID=UPI003BA8C5EB